MSNAEIYQRLSVSSPTSISLINELVRDNLLERKGLGESSGGRKPELFGLKKDSLFVLGIEIGKYKTRMAIFNNYNENITGTKIFPITLSQDTSALNEVYKNASQLIRTQGIDTKKLLGIGLNTPGLVDAKEGINYTYLKNGQKSLRTLLQEKFNRPVYVENDAKAMTLAEYRFGLAQGLKDVLVIYVDWGIGLGIIQNGKLYRGANGFAGEFSHIPIVENGLLCGCGKRGCLETVASATALVNLAKEGIGEGKSAILKNMADVENAVDPSAIVEAASRGDQYSTRLLSEVGFNLGKGISILVQLLNPEKIIIGGKLAEANEYILTPIQQALNVYCMPQLREKTSINLSNLGQNAGILGSVAMVMEHIFDDFIDQ